MSTPIDDGGPAFPIPELALPDIGGIKQGWDGMTRRDWLAGIVLPECIRQAGDISPPAREAAGYPTVPEFAAALAYRAADAMIAEGRKEHGDD